MDTFTLSALAEPNRMRIIELLREKPCAVGEIAKRLDLRQPQVSKHLRVLSEAGLVELRPMAQQHIFALRSEPFRELGGWLETFRQTWNSRLDSLDETLQEMKRAEQQDPG